jgi:hypothetical protein
MTFRWVGRNKSRAVKVGAARWLASAIVLPLVLLIGGPTIGVSWAVDLKEIADSHRRQEESLKSLYVAYHSQSEALGKPSDMQRYLGIGYLGNENWVFAFKGSFRYAKMNRSASFDHIVEKMPDGSPKRINTNAGGEWAFNGKESYVLDGTPAWRRHPVAVITPPHLETCDDASYFNQEYMTHIFRKLPDAFNISKDREKNSLPGLIAHVTCKVLADPEVVDGAPCVLIEWTDDYSWYDLDLVLRSEQRRHVLCCDPKIGYSVRRHDLYFPVPHGQLLAERTLLSTFVEVTPGVWLPRLCLWERFAPPEAPDDLHNSPLIRYRYEVGEIHANDISDNLFTPTIPAGTFVNDKRHMKDGHSICYTMPASQQELDTVVQALLKGTDFVPPQAPRSLWRRYRTGGLVLLNLLFIAGLGYYFFKRRKTNK